MMKTLKIYSFGSAFLLSCLLSTSLSAPLLRVAVKRQEDANRVLNAVATVADRIDNPVDRAEDFIGNYTPQEKEKRDNVVRDLVTMALEKDFQAQLKDSAYATHLTTNTAELFREGLTKDFTTTTNNFIHTLNGQEGVDKERAISNLTAQLDDSAYIKRTALAASPDLIDETIWGEFTQARNGIRQRIIGLRKAITTQETFTHAYIDDQFAQQLAGIRITPMHQQHLDNAKNDILARAIHAQKQLTNMWRDESQRIETLEQGKKDALKKIQTTLLEDFKELADQLMADSVAKLAERIDQLSGGGGGDDDTGRGNGSGNGDTPNPDAGGGGDDDTGRGNGGGGGDDENGRGGAGGGSGGNPPPDAGGTGPDEEDTGRGGAGSGNGGTPNPDAGGGGDDDTGRGGAGSDTGSNHGNDDDNGNDEQASSSGGGERTNTNKKKNKKKKK